MRQTNQAGVDLIKEFEGFRSEAYLCPADVWTIGYGHTKGVQPGDVVTAEEAEDLLREDLAWAEKAVWAAVEVPLTDDQFAALVSFTFNLGEGALRSSTLLRRLNAGEHEAVPSELMRWNKAGGKVLAGLTRRREAEGALWGSEAAEESEPEPDEEMTAERIVKGWKQIQRGLRTLGKNPGPIDGIEGRQTWGAIDALRLSPPRA